MRLIASFGSAGAACLAYSAGAADISAFRGNACVAAPGAISSITSGSSCHNHVAGCIR